MCTSPNPAPAVVYCDADECFLCSSCDEDVHQVNRFAQRHVRRPVSAVDAVDFQGSDSSELVVPDVSDNVGNGLSLQEELELSSEGGDVVYADFDDFESVAFAKMPALSVCDSDSAFFPVVPSSSLRQFDSDELSWEAVVPIEFDHVVPDVESTPAPVKGAPVVVKAEVASDAGNDHTRPEPGTPAMQRVAVSAPLGCAEKKSESPSISNVTLPRRGSREDLVATSPSGDSDAVDECRTAEQRKQVRKEALARFRSKRASRNFQKKIRYNCRKMLADSRPRVKGRFVKKSEMALYRRYGAEYREHLSEGLCVHVSSEIGAPLDCS
jgi:hypothetical protein